jgi:hypothetical protein
MGYTLYKEVVKMSGAALEQPPIIEYLLLPGETG